MMAAACCMTMSGTFIMTARMCMQPECRVYLAMTKCDLLEDPTALGPTDATTNAAGSDDSAGRPFGLPAATLQIVFHLPRPPLCIQEPSFSYPLSPPRSSATLHTNMQLVTQQQLSALARQQFNSLKP